MRELFYKSSSSKVCLIKRHLNADFVGWPGSAGMCTDVVKWRESVAGGGGSQQRP